MSVAAADPGEWRAPWTWEERHPVASELEWCPASAELAARMAELDPADVDEEALVEGIAAWERLAAWAAEGQARWVNELAARARTGAEIDRLPDEVATRLAITRRAAEAKVELAAGLQQHPRLAVGMNEGWLSERKAAVLLHDVEHLPHRLADAVLDRVLDRAGERTGPQLRADVRAAELALDAAAAAARHEHARRDRCVRMVPAPDAMAWIHALLPAPDAAAVMTALDAAAATREPGDDRTADQRRADALTSLARRVLDSGLGPDGDPLVERQHRRPHLLISVARASGPGAGRGPGGPGPSTATRRGSARWRTWPATGPCPPPRSPTCCPRPTPARSPWTRTGCGAWSSPAPIATGPRRSWPVRWWSGTGPVGSPAAGCRPSAATSTTWCRSTRAARPAGRPSGATSRHCAGTTTA